MIRYHHKTHWFPDNYRSSTRCHPGPMTPTLSRQSNIPGAEKGEFFFKKCISDQLQGMKFIANFKRIAYHGK